jgi:hypothetical protein
VAYLGGRGDHEDEEAALGHARGRDGSIILEHLAIVDDLLAVRGQLAVALLDLRLELPNLDQVVFQLSHRKRRGRASERGRSSRGKTEGYMRLTVSAVSTSSSNFAPLIFLTVSFIVPPLQGGREGGKKER